MHYTRPSVPFMPHAFWYTKGTEQNIMYVIIILSIGGSFMLKQTKIRYHYDFPNLPITNNDIQALYEKMNDILWIAESYIHQLDNHEMHLPDIFISDDIVTKTYGKYDYKAILKEIRKYYEKYPYSYFGKLLEQLVNIIKNLEKDTHFGDLKELIDSMEAKLDHTETEGELKDINQIIYMLKNNKRTVNTLGSYNYKNNRITLYINAIINYFSKAPIKDLSTQIKIGLEIVLAHEVFHAIQYHLMISENAKTGKYLWEHPVNEESYRNTVLEGLARWFEYSWCNDAKYDNPIYAWHMNQIEKELHNHYYPGWPYAAAKVFIQNGNPLIDEPIMILNLVLESVLKQRQSCWNYPYEVLKILESRNQRQQQKRAINPAHNNNPKMIFLRP